MSRHNDKSIDEQLDEIGIPGGTESTPPVTTPVAPSTSTGPRQESTTLQLIVAKKGRWIDVVPFNTEIVDEMTDTRVPNPKPSYQYVWSDGSYLNVSGTGGVSGTALNDLASTGNTTPTFRDTPTGGTVMWDPNAGTEGAFRQAPGMPLPAPKVDTWTEFGSRKQYDPSKVINPATIDTGMGLLIPSTGVTTTYQNPYEDYLRRVDAEQAGLDLDYKRAQLAKLNAPPQGATSSPTDYMREGREADKWAWERGEKFPWEKETWQKTYDLTQKKNESDADYNNRRIAMETAQNEALRKQWLAQNEQSRQDLVSRTADWMTGRTTDASKWAMTPGQEYFMGFEPGGAWEDVARRSGFNYDPNMFRPQPVRFDPQAQLIVADAWTQEQARKRGGG